MEPSPEMRRLATLEIGTGCGLALFWLLFFTVGLAPANAPVCYFVYEHAFPLPDLVLAAALVLAGTLLLRSDARGRDVSLAAAGGLIFLGLVDFAFNARNGMYTISLFEGLGNAAINAWCVALGALILHAFWPRRTAPA